jgi:hypothetical protein
MIPSMIWLFGTYSVNTDTSDFFPHNVVTWVYFFHIKRSIVPFAASFVFSLACEKQL